MTGRLPTREAGAAAAVIRPRRLLCVWLLVCAALLVGAGRASAQDLAPREVRLQAQRALQEGAYDNAIILIQQWIEWFKDSSKREVIIDLESWYFNLGLCYYLTGQFGEAEKAFKVYLKKYRNGPHASQAEIYIADGQRYSEKLAPALRGYQKVLESYRLNDDWKTDVYCSMARCHLAQDQWAEALPHLEKVYAVAPDNWRADWAATLLTIAFLKELQVTRVFNLVPFLVQPSSLASRSVAFNMAALEAADELFAEERYRDALWVFRLVYPKEEIKKRGERHLEHLGEQIEDLRKAGGRYRELLRTQETIAELEAELKGLEEVEQYGIDLAYRIARSYMEIRRYREARALFLYLRDEVDDEARVEELLYLAFHCSTQIRPWGRAFELGAQYMEEYPAKEYYDLVSLTVGQLHAMKKEWPMVISVLTKALEVSPEHESIAECMFLIGYASFMEEKFPEAVHWFGRLRREFPANERAEEATYWLGMSYLFNKQYEDGKRTFGVFLADYPKSVYVEDATFRLAVCIYGLSDFREAERRLSAFAARYPKSSLTGEAYMMLADIAGNFGESEAGVARYRKALQHELNIELYNYCAFRCGEMLFDMNDFDGVVEHFKAYIRRNRDGSNRPMAVYWVGRGLWQEGEQQKGMEFLMQSVSKFGKAPDALGIDLILEEWIGRSKELTPLVAKEAWRYLGTLLRVSREEKEATLTLRLERTFLYKPDLSDKAKEIIVGSLCKEENLPVASAAVLEFIMDEAPKREMSELGLQAAHALVDRFTETDYALTARMFIAERAMADKDYGAAEEQLRVIREVFATSSEAAQALLLLGKLYMIQRKYEQADKCFRDVLGVREWRGPLWPAALHGRGECAEAQRDFAKACAYYERIYLMYGHHKSWCAKAYLQRANCLIRLQEPRKARETLEEMLSNTELAAAAEAEPARELLGRLQRREL